MCEAGANHQVVQPHKSYMLVMTLQVYNLKMLQILNINKYGVWSFCGMIILGGINSKILRMTFPSAIFFHHKSQMDWPGIKPNSSLSETGN